MDDSFAYKIALQPCRTVERIKSRDGVIDLVLLKALYASYRKFASTDTKCGQRMH
jgi:hypothetical protein